MSKWRVYINPFNDAGEYTDFIDVTNDVLFKQIGTINTDLDNTEYDIGVYRVSNFKITLRNDHARYSDVNYSDSIFRYKRSDSLVKITWEIEIDGPYVGIAESESGYLSEEIEVFSGLLSDASLTMDLSKQTVDFTCLGKETNFTSTIVPFATVSNGDLYSSVLFNILNQPGITNLLTVNQANISCSVDNTIDSIASLQNQTVQEGLNNLLLASNSVLYISNNTIFVAPRVATAAVIFTFFGQTSPNGPENILDVQKISNGLGTLFNYFTWTSSTIFSENTSSINKYGASKKAIDIAFTTDDAKRQAVLDDLCAEFANPKQTFSVITPVTYETLATTLLSKVSIDYPIVYVSTGRALPICGTAICGGDSFLPKPLSSFQILPTNYYKVIGRSVDPSNNTITFKMREI